MAIARFGMQDVSRFRAYGVGQTRELLAARPHEMTTIADHLGESERCCTGVRALAFIELQGAPA